MRIAINKLQVAITRLQFTNLRLTAVFLFIGYLFFAYTFPLLPNFDIAPTVDGRFFEPSFWGGIKYVLILCWLFGFYALAQKQLRQLTVPPKLWQLAMVTAVFSNKIASKALYLQRLFEDRDLQLTRLATGIPVGGALAYIDEVTLQRAFQFRRSF